ncbi:Abscisic acid receptor PYL8 [Striga hermonthica]|uniref:Abscisic acid receptor PYL8 n=1 Tax=Striga hermonthica TaxID=68872 RepID=A0A9N7R5V6_STRHE|nr:Abscisic acid receptor PYL8 [Striga hermonthica]
MMMNFRGLSGLEKECMLKHHEHETKDNQCSSFLIKHVKAPVHLVWSLVRSFDQPQKYKPFVSRCHVQGNLEIGSLREVDVKSGLPATTSTERLELLDDDEHVLSVRIVGGDHRLRLAGPFGCDIWPARSKWGVGPCDLGEGSGLSARRAEGTASGWPHRAARTSRSLQWKDNGPVLPWPK